MAGGPLYLGFDLSTQQLKAIVVQSDLTVVSEVKVGFDEDLGHKYPIKKGVYVKESENEVVSPVAMFLDAIDLVLARLAEKTPMNLIRGISGSCQQHGSTYWSHDAEQLLGSMTADKDLAHQLKPAFSHPYAPNWQDGSTQKQCDQLNAHFGSPQKLAEVTGSAAHHRFTGSQIMRLREKEPEMYANTSRISLISSFFASVLLGSVAPIDISEVTGMNLWDITRQAWDDSLLALTAGSQDGVADLRSKLGTPRFDGGGSMGSISPYFQKKYGFAVDCHIAPFTGDNPATILSLPLRPLDAIVSLGTSSTFLMNTPIYKPDESYHFMNHPCTPEQYMFMLCYKNGGLARESVRDKLPKPKDSSNPWANFNECAFNTPPLGIAHEEGKTNGHESNGTNGSTNVSNGHANGVQGRAKMGLYFDLPEIVPNINAGTWRYTVSPSGDLDTLREEKDERPWGEDVDPRIIVESQALSMRLRSQNLVKSPESNPSLPAQPRRIYLVGGGSLNPAIAQIMGEVLGGVDGVYRLDVGGNACALGGAYKAVWAMERGEGESFDELIGKRWREEEATEKIDVGFRDGVFQQYGKVVPAFEEMEKRILQVAHN